MALLVYVAGIVSYHSMYPVPSVSMYSPMYGVCCKEIYVYVVHIIYNSSLLLLLFTFIIWWTHFTVSKLEYLIFYSELSLKQCQCHQSFLKSIHCLLSNQRVLGFFFYVIVCTLKCVSHFKAGVYRFSVIFGQHVVEYYHLWRFSLIKTLG